MADPFIGEIRMFAGDFAPLNWAFCNGQTINVNQNTALFSIFGAIYGGDGRNDFGVPNLQGRAPMGAGQGPGLTNRPIGQVGGANTHTVASISSHTHNLTADEAVGTTGTPSSSVTLAEFPKPSILNPYTTTRNYVNTAASALANNSTTGAAYDNLQPYQVVNFIVALNGVFPSQS